MKIHIRRGDSREGHPMGAGSPVTVQDTHAHPVQCKYKDITVMSALDSSKSVSHFPHPS